MLPLHHGPMKRTTRIERASPGWRPVLFRLSYVRAIRPAGVEPAASAVSEQCSPAELQGVRRSRKRESLRQESNPHPGRTKGVCLPLTLRRHGWRRRESNPLLLGASEALCHQSFIPETVRTGGVEPPQPEATGLQRGELTSAQRPQETGWPTGFEPILRGSRPRVLPLHHSHHEDGDDRTRTGDLSPDKRVLCR